MRKYKNNKKKINLYAFSLIEIMIVVLLIGLVSGTATILLFNRFNESKISIAKNQTYEITKASELYKLRFNHYPKNINQLIYPGNGIFPYMEKIPKDPWGKKYIYRYPGIKNKTKPDIYTYIFKGKKKIEIGNW
jgi:general secretion pathway protein G